MASFEQAVKEYDKQQLQRKPSGQSFETLVQEYNRGQLEQSGGLPFLEQKSTLRKVGEALTSSERGLAHTFGEAAATLTPEYRAAQESQIGLDDMNIKLGKKIVEQKKLGKDTSRLQELYQRNTGRVFKPEEIVPSITKTKSQIAGEAGGVALDIATAGALAKGASTFKLFGAGEKAAVAAKQAKKGLSVSDVIIKNIESSYKPSAFGKAFVATKKAAPKIAGGAAIGYGYDVTGGLQEGKTGTEAFTPGVGTAVGALIPGSFLAIKGAKSIGKSTAPRIVDSLIKPLLKDYSYGKTPGKAVAESGIVANNLEELAEKISTVRGTVGREIGGVMNTLEGRATLDLTSAYRPIDEAMQVAAKQNNGTLLARLKSVKEALTKNLELDTDALGNPTIVSKGEKNLSQANFSDALKTKIDIGDMTQWTGNASDDKIVNKALKQIYGEIKDKINTIAESLDPVLAAKLKKLNEKYANLTSAEIATKYRDKLESRQNLVSLAGKNIGAVAAATTAILSGGGNIGAILAGLGGAVLDKVLGSTAVKTRVASWLANETPSTIEKIYQRNPNLRKAIGNAFSEDILNRNKKKGLDFLRPKGERPAGGVIDKLLSNPVKKIGTGDFGDIYHGIQEQKAIEFLMKNKSGEVKDALLHPGVKEPIDLVYGKKGENGYGLAHIEEKHPGIIKQIPSIIKDSEVIKQANDRILLLKKMDDGVHIAAIRLDWNGKKKTWLVTAFKEL